MGLGNKSSFKLHGHMTKMAAMLIYGKNLKKIFFSGTKRPMTLKLGMRHRVLKYYPIPSNDEHWLTLTCVCVCEFGFNVAFTNNFQSYHDGVWLRQGAQCSLL